MNWEKVRQFVRIGGMILGLFIFLYLFFSSLQDLHFSPIKEEFSPGLIVLSLLIYLFVYLLQMLNLKLLYASIQKKITTKDVIKGYSFSFLPKYIPGYVWGYFTRGAWFEKNNGITAGNSWIASTVEIITTITTGSVVVSDFLLWKNGTYGFLLIVFFLTPVIEYLLIIFANEFMLPKCSKLRSGKFEFSFSGWIFIYANSMFQWILLGTSLSLLCKALGIKSITSSESIFWSSYAFARSWLTGFLAFVVPNGIGVREFVLKDLLFVELGISSQMAALISTISRLTLFVAEILWILVALVITHREKGKDNPNVLL